LSFFVRSGYAPNGIVSRAALNAENWSKTTSDNIDKSQEFWADIINRIPVQEQRRSGISLRCLAI